MLYFELYGKLAFLFAVLFCVGLILLALVIYYSAGNYRKPIREDGTVDEHTDPGVPLVLKALYVGVAIYILVVTLIVAIKGCAL